MLKPRVVVHLHPGSDLYHASKLLTGLVHLARRGDVSLRFRAMRPDAPGFGQGALLRLDLEEGSQSRCLYVDLYDRSDAFDVEALRVSDVYWKRSYLSEDVQRLAGELSAKVRPLGANHATRTSESLAWLATFAVPRIASAWRPERTKRFAAGLRTWKVLAQLPEPDDYELTPWESVSDSVFFQPRLWEDSQLGPDSSEAVNAPRVELVRKLKATFGARFQGGLAPSPLALQRYPHMVTHIPHRRRDYILFAKRHLVAVCTRGLHHSTPFKIAEALAASKVIVTEPVRNRQQAELLPGQHLIEFRSVDECVDACERALSTPSLVRDMREANWEYYRRWVEPSGQVHGLLWGQA